MNCVPPSHNCKSSSAPPRISQCPFIGCGGFLRSVGTSCKKKKFPGAMNSANFLLDISGKHSGNRKCPEPVHGKPCARGVSFCCILPDALPRALLSVQMPSLAGRSGVCGHACVQAGAKTLRGGNSSLAGNQDPRSHELCCFKSRLCRLELLS